MPRKKKETTAITIANPLELEGLLAPMRTEAETALQQIAKMDLSTQTKRDGAGRALNAIRGRIQELEEMRKARTKPLLDTKKWIDDLFRPVREFYEACDRTLDKALRDASNAAADAQRKALAEVAAAAGNTDHATLQVAHATPQTPEGLAERDKWTWEVEDEGKVPAEWKMTVLDESKIDKHVRSLKGDAKIEGIKVYKVTEYVRDRSPR